MQLPVKEKVSETKQIIETNAKDAPVKDVLWNVNQLETESVRIQDPGAGSAVVLRQFYFKETPQAARLPKPTKLQLINQHKRLIETTLWADGLIIRYDRPIEVLSLSQARKVSKSLHRQMLIHRANFVILVMAEPRSGKVVTDQFSIAK